MREKIIDLLKNGVRCPFTVKECSDCPYFDVTAESKCREAEATADMLIAQGFILQEWFSADDPPPLYMPVITCRDVKNYEQPVIGIDKIIETYGQRLEWGEDYRSDRSNTTHWTHLPKPPKR